MPSTPLRGPYRARRGRTCRTPRSRRSGAGGLGQPILTAIRLGDAGLVPEGAVPAALLALLLQGPLSISPSAPGCRAGLRLTAED